MSRPVDPVAGPAAAGLHETRQAYLAVATATGPHVAPALYAFDRRRRWFFAASRAVKVGHGSPRGALPDRPWRRPHVETHRRTTWAGVDTGTEPAR